MGLRMRLGTSGQRQVDSAEQQLIASLSAEAKTEQQASVNICVHCITKDGNI